MNNPEQIELINAAVDGELDATGLEDLNALLASSEGARTYHQELQNLVAFFEATPAAVPPSGLRERILSGVELPAPKRKWFGFFDAWTNFGRAAPRPAHMVAAAAAGVLVTIGAYTVSESVPGVIPVEQLVGTMAGGNPAVDAQGPEKMQIDTSAVSGSAVLELIDEQWVVGFDLVPQRPVVVDVRIEGSSGAPLQFVIQDQRRVWAAVARNNAGTPPAVSFTILTDKTAIYSGAFGAAQ